MLLSFAVRHPLAFGFALCVFGWPLDVRGDSACPLRVEPRSPATVWHDKAREVENVISAQGAHQHDCRSIQIEVQPEGNALLTFTTTDGRIAVRLLHTPEDIAATVEALLVTLPVEKPLEVPSMPTKSSPIPATPAKPRPEPATDSTKAVRNTPRMLFDVFAGVRLGVDVGVSAPAVGLQAMMQFAPWEIGIGGELNPLYLRLVDSTPAGYAMRSFEGHLLVGRRFVHGPRAFRLGASMGVGLVHEETDADPAVKGRVNIDAFQPRIGLYGGLVVPREGAFRLSAGIFGDVALWGLRENGTAKRDLPDLSRFGLGLCVGMEVAP